MPIKKAAQKKTTVKRAPRKKPTVTASEPEGVQHASQSAIEVVDTAREDVPVIEPGKPKVSILTRVKATWQAKKWWVIIIGAVLLILIGYTAIEKHGDKKASGKVENAKIKADDVEARFEIMKRELLDSLRNSKEEDEAADAKKKD